MRPTAKRNRPHAKPVVDQLVRRAKLVVIVLAMFVVGLVLNQSASADSNWPGWRGPTGDGHSAENALPAKWDAKSIVWKTGLKGDGQSSPTIWGERIFLTTALDGGKQRMVFCVDRNRGEILWERVAWTGQPEPTHKMNGWASASCTTDGEHVYAFFGKGGLHCYTVAGEHVWSRDLGEFVGPWGTAACPVLSGDILIQNCDADEDAYLLGVNKLTGEDVWKTDREDHRGWSTPVIVPTTKRIELVVNGHTGTRAYDPQSGKELWFCRGGERGRGTPTVTPGGGLIHVVNGLPGDIYAVKPGGSGAVVDTHRVWHTPRKGRDLPSPIFLNDYLLVVNKAGVLTCYAADSGKEIWTERLGGNCAATPVAYSGLAFFTNEDGDTYVVKPGPKMSLLATNSLSPADDEIFRASITPSDGQIFIRSNQTLYCIGTRKPAR